MSVSQASKKQIPNLGATYFRLEQLERTLLIKIRCKDHSYTSAVIRQEIISDYDIDWEERSKIVKQAQELAEKLWDIKLSATAAFEPYLPYNMRCDWENEASERLDEWLAEIQATREYIAARYVSWRVTA